jgi:hypothetical protein
MRSRANLGGGGLQAPYPPVHHRVGRSHAEQLDSARSPHGSKPLTPLQQNDREDNLDHTIDFLLRNPSVDLAAPGEELLAVVSGFRNAFVNY